MTRRVLVAAAWPYANGPRHIGHVAGFAIPADIFARYHRMAGNAVLMVSGTDEHGTPITVEAERRGLTPAEFADQNNEIIAHDLERLGMSYDLFTRTTTPLHARVTQDVFLTLLQAGAIFSKESLGAFSSASGRALPDRYIEGTCPHCNAPDARGDQCDHCGRQLDPVELIAPRSRVDGASPVFRETTHFFLDLPRFTERIRAWIEGHDTWRPNVKRFSLNLLESALPRAITRDIDWGIPIPLPEYGPGALKRIYVWFDAVIGYLSASIEWAELQGDPEAWRRWWQEPGAEHAYFMGKDNIVFHSFLWPAMLMAYDAAGAFAAGKPLVLPKDVVSSEFLTMEGAKFSTSRNVVIYVRDVLDRYGPDPLRFYLSIAGPERQDADFQWSEFVRRNNDELVANWGNLVNRVVTLTQRVAGAVPALDDLTAGDQALLDAVDAGFATVGPLIESEQFKAAIGECMRLAREANVYISQEAPWATAEKAPARTRTVLGTALTAVANLNVMLAPFLPHAAGRVCRMLGLEAPALPTVRVVPSGGAPHRAIVTDDAARGPRWQPLRLAPGGPIGPTERLFTKLPDAVVEEELARLAAG